MNATMVNAAALAALIAIAGFCCTEDSGETSNPTEAQTEKPSPVGTWYNEIKAGLMTDHAIGIDFSVHESNEYRILVVEVGDDTLALHSGTWDTTADSITLRGDLCRVLDTTANPDTLMSMPDSICMAPFTLTRPTAQTWIVATAPLHPIVESIIPADFFTIARTIMLHKQDRE